MGEEFLTGNSDEIAIADPNSNKKQEFVDRYLLNEGRYRCQFSDESEKQKERNSEVVISALMPAEENDSHSNSEQLENDRLSDGDVDKLLQNIEDIFDDLSCSDGNNF